MFEITQGRSAKNQGTRILVDVERAVTAIPKAVLIGGGDRKTKLKAHYSKCLGANATSSAQQALFQFFAFIYGHGKKDNKGLHLVCASKNQPIHTQAVKEFLIENSEVLDLVSGYVVDGIRPVAQTTDNCPLNGILDEATSDVSDMMSFNGSSVQLPPEEMVQIQMLIEEDQARERLAQSLKE